MEEVHVIHSETRLDRLELIQNEAMVQGFTIRFHPAVFSSKPARGISQAHRNVIQFAKDSGIPRIIVLEDDCHFTNPGAFDYWISKIPEEYDIYLGGIYVIKKLNPDGTIRDHSGMHCYIVHERFYDTFLGVNPDKNIDSALWGLGVYKLCDPLVAIQHQTFSDHHKEVLNNSEQLDGRNRFFGGRSFY